MSRWLAPFLCLVMWPTTSKAGPCDGLKPDQKKLVSKLMESTHPYDCCDETLDRCLKQKKVCRVAVRLRDEICRRVSAGQPEADVKTALEKRARSMTPMGQKATFDLSLAPPAGEGKAVTVVVYACARCPMCKRVVPDLYRLVANDLKAKAKIYFRPFPIRTHEGSLEGGLAFLAAAQLKHFWPFVERLFADFDRFAVDKLPHWAAQVGMDREAFKRAMGDSTLRELLVKAKKEGLRNGVGATPTVFINSRRYQGSLDRETLRDVLEEEADRVSGRQY